MGAQRIQGADSREYGGKYSDNRVMEESAEEDRFLQINTTNLS